MTTNEIQNELDKIEKWEENIRQIKIKSKRK